MLASIEYKCSGSCCQISRYTEPFSFKGRTADFNTRMRGGLTVDIEAIKGQAVAAISGFNTRQTSTVEMIDIAPWNMRVLDQDTLFRRPRESG